MSERFPDRPQELSTTELKEVSKFERRSKRRVRTTLASYAVLLSTAIGSHVYMSDAVENMYEQDELPVSVETIETSDSANFLTFNNGLNSLDADIPAENIGPAVQQITPSSIESLYTGDSPRTPTEIAQSIIEYAHANGKTNVSLFGYSVGGLETIKAAVKLIHESDIQVDIIYLSATPESLDSLRPEKRYQLNALTTALSFVPWSEHSDYAKFLINLGFNKEIFMPGDNLLESVGNFNPEAFGRTWDRVAREVETKQYPGISTLEYQINLARTNIRSDIHKIAEAIDKVMPTIVYLKIPKDNTVNNTEASEKICSYAEEVEIPCIIVPLENGQHNMHYTKAAAEAYSNGLLQSKDEILASRDQQNAIYAARNWVDIVARGTPHNPSGPQLR